MTLIDVLIVLTFAGSIAVSVLVRNEMFLLVGMGIIIVLSLFLPGS